MRPYFFVWYWHGLEKEECIHECASEKEAVAVLCDREERDEREMPYHRPGMIATVCYGVVLKSFYGDPKKGMSL